MAEEFPPYDVFINHRGPDAKNTLASLIYHYLKELKVFLDDEELRGGDSITSAIQSAIRSAPVHIAIFSKRYAESVWCLKELLWMRDSDPTFSKIIPIFYDIEPSGLRKVEEEPYATAFEEHRRKGRDTVDSWIKALKEVSAVSGVVFKTEIDDHGKRLKQIAEIVLKKVGRVQMYVCKHPVGLRQAAEHFKKEVLSRSKSSSTRIVGIVGLGGSGKSTLATHLYNSMCSQFHRSCFLSEVRKKDLCHLQQTLLRNLRRNDNFHIKNTREGMKLLGDRLQGLRRVLIVFDDINNTEQIDKLLFVKDLLGDGSLILVTSRDKSLLESSKVKIYNVKLLEEKHAQELFCLHAFADTKPVHDLQEMVEQSVRMCGGFPLALKCLAGLLHNKLDPRKWKWHLERLRKQLPKDLLKQIVMDSYESLDNIEKEAFLDVAYFFVGEDTDLVERILDGLNGNGFECLQTLRNKCLVEFEREDIIRSTGVNSSTAFGIGRKGSFKLRMHDLVRNLTRQIRGQELPLRISWSSDYPTFIWDASANQTRGIRLDKDTNWLLLQHSFPQNMCGLKFLAIEDSIIPMAFKNMSVSGDLTWLRLTDTSNYSSVPESDSIRIPPTLLLRDLRVLEVHGVSLEVFRRLFDDLEAPPQLFALDVTFPKGFGRVSAAGPSTAASAKHGSTSKTSDSLQPPINGVPWFQALLEKLIPKNLRKIVLRNSPGLNTLPNKFEEARNLRHVDLSGCSYLEVLPHSFTEELSELQYLALRDCRNLVLEDLGKISKLEYLDFQGCSMLSKMPRGTELQKALKYLNVVHTQLLELPQCLGQLEDLEELHIGGSNLREIPSSLYNLTKLTELNLLGCTNLFSIDNSVEKLTNLESLRIYKCGIRMLPERIACMNMKILDVQECPLESEQLLTGVDSGNMSVNSSQEQGSIGQGAHPNHSGCLTDLIIRHSNIEEIHIPRAESLFPKLEVFDLSENYILKEIGNLPGNLISLNLTNCSGLRTLAFHSSLVRLEVLDISGCKELETLNVKGLSSIKVIKGNGCWKLHNIQGLDLLEKLSNFQISINLRDEAITSSFLKDCGLRVVGKLTNHMDSAIFFSRTMRLEGAILVYLITNPNCNVQLQLHNLDYTIHSSGFNNKSGHMVMLTGDHFVGWINRVLISNPSRSLHIREGWIFEAKNVFEMTQFLSKAININATIQATD